MQTQIILLFIVAISCAHGFCVTTAAYHIAAQALAAGLSNDSVIPPCQYSNDESDNYLCPVTCKALITATWGDCYCTDQNYRPYAGDSYIRMLTAKQIFSFIAKETPGLPWTKGVYCRAFMQDNADDWAC